MLEPTVQDLRHVMAVGKTSGPTASRSEVSAAVVQGSPSSCIANGLLLESSVSLSRILVARGFILCLQFAMTRDSTFQDVMLLSLVTSRTVARIRFSGLFLCRAG